MGTAFRTIRALAGDAWTPDAISFSHPPPQGRTIHSQFFKSRPYFNNDFDGITLRSSDLNAPISTADPVMAHYVRRYLDGMIAQPIVTIDATVRQLVYALLPSGRCTSDLLAHHLGIDRRTLNRRLASRDETFSSIVNKVRVELARRHIKVERRSLTETAQLLGFSGLPTFSRWFQQQFGISASAWRKAGSADEARPLPVGSTALRTNKSPRRGSVAHESRAAMKTRASRVEHRTDAACQLRTRQRSDFVGGGSVIDAPARSSNDDQAPVTIVKSPESSCCIVMSKRKRSGGAKAFMYSKGSPF